MSDRSSVTVERATMDDLDRLVECWLELAAGQREYGSHLQTAANRSRIRESFARRIAREQTHLARSGDRIVGFVTFTMEGSTFAKSVRRGVVQNLYVVPEMRGEGVGTQLLAAAERVLADAGADVISLEAMADNEPARQFYRDRGYRPHRVTFEKPVESDTP
ncbi:GNAT family N-acetyltransferase [Halapricum hydrolyticum]|uniref:GNAT family N-acetyltransferase n=1 Tax=Halapricum hydrolyticum TaxID=2979991 RepID=A0AAE3I9J0_9EURY|nr:GNAT family N-acetyltransferase [Halapricum hydrolyticum]MCU4716553.1 GNAT family N-acetyltransferase [Halapricum hydrolyticum]MCU4725842.1 GNAT family N-acetyltransferase [Halapricum hydrolyticum]